MSGLFRFLFGLRFKLVFLSCFLFTIPWLGHQYVLEMEKLLRKGQEQTLLGTARALATALHERPKLFDKQASFLSTVKKGRDLYAYQITYPIRLDGAISDWKNYRQYALHYGQSHLIDNTRSDHSEIISYQESTLNFQHLVGKYDRYLYIFFEVVDDKVVYRPSNSLRVDRNDHLQIAFLNQQDEFQRFIIATVKPGWVNAFRVDKQSESVEVITPETRIEGQWLQTTLGYNLELRIPLDMLGEKLSFAIADVDDEKKRMVKAVVGTSSTENIEQLGTVLVPSPEIERIVKGMGHTRSRIWVVDQHQRVLASAGDIKTASGIWTSTFNQNENKDSYWYQLEKNILHPIYYQILTKPPEDFIDDLYDAARLESRVITSALKGQQDLGWRISSDKQAIILSAAHPIWIEDKVMGSVIVEETNNMIRTFRNQALEKLFNILLAVMTLSTLALFLFASRISSRIRRLRNEAEEVIDEQGRFKNTIKGSKARDEIGDLARSFSSIVERLSQYTNYLENMSSRLSHELRTPVAVVRSSLENLTMVSLDKDAHVYMERAQEGLNRLNLILTNMSEATRLEQMLQSEEKESFNLAEIISACMESYQYTYKGYEFDIQVSEQPLMITGVPEYIAQLMDKLIANAVEFSLPEHKIYVKVYQAWQNAVITIENQGPYLPEEMQDRIFDSMISVRPQQKHKQPHLGIGLHIARLITEFHQGMIKAENREDFEGVIVTVSIPLD